MANPNITFDLELFEVLNAFPVLKGSLEKLDFNLKDVKEGESVEDFFKRMKLADDEAQIILKRLNRDMKHYMKTGEGFKNKEIDVKANI